MSCVAPGEEEEEYIFADLAAIQYERYPSTAVEQLGVPRKRVQ
jgi:hypothetical protein